ncbi:MAG: hypothetical protein ABEL04_14525 [Salinibacter sp.]|uniref:hypothetical protein n=1 Tax=Salinibacter sp. TaxID=2065818 RepID=UPI0035D4F8AC
MPSTGDRLNAARSQLFVERDDEVERAIRAGLAAFPDSTLTLEQYVADPPRVSVF